ncbi:NAD kinase-like [Babylonia areolata]|uniref:NAD kinase-like n=1 Tax=Babylonia areolata TaxID=304850 RepID=UPI003FD0321E
MDNDMDFKKRASTVDSVACDTKCLPETSLDAPTCQASPTASDCSVSQGTDNFKTSEHATDLVEPNQNSKKESTRRKKARSLYGVSPHCKFGPKGFLVDCTGAFLKIPDPSSQKLNWLKVPVSVLVIKKPCDSTVTSAFRELVVWLVQEKNLEVYVEEGVATDDGLSRDPHFKSVYDRLHRFKEGVDELEDKVDFIVCLGGDGTLLYASSLFQQSVPPVIAFNMGSLGFLTPFPFTSFRERIGHLLKGQVPLSLRYRLKCVLQDQSDDTGQPSSSSSSTATTSSPMHLRHQDSTSHISTYVLVLNEVVIDRGPSSFLCNLDLYIEGHLVTSVLGDGLIICTPTGSTAYSVAAGSSMIHPSVPCILLTPICPHSLSFRPIVVPAGVEVKVMLAPEARSPAMASFDGRNRQQINKGVSLRVTTASYPLPSVCAQGQIEDWFSGLADCLHWNVRKPQRAMSQSTSLTSLESEDLEAPGKHGTNSHD